MAAVGVEEDPAVQAARILLSLRKRKLLRWPEWVQKEPATAVVEVRWPLEGWPKRPRSGGRLRGDWRAVLAPPKLEIVASSIPVGSGPCSSGEERERSPAVLRWRERPRAGPSRDELMAARRPDSPARYSALAGSGPSTSADRKARPLHSVEKASMASAAAAVELPKEPMTASSPETPLDFGAAGSGASSSGDDAARPPPKRRAAEALGSGGGASSGDEGCSSPDKRARVAPGDGDGEKAISEPNMETPDDSKKAVKFEFDLNVPPEDEEYPGFC